MAIRRISGNVRIGGIYECDFGSYKKINGGLTVSRDEADDTDLNYRIPNEMIKRRPVVVISRHKGLCTVVPVSATEEKAHKNPKKDMIIQGVCVPLQGHMPQTHFYTSGCCWAICYAAQTIDIGRLRDIYNRDVSEFVRTTVSSEMLLKLRFGVIKAIGLSSLVPSSEEDRINEILGLS